MTNSLFWLKICIALGVILLLGLAIGLWMKTPELFEYFNQAFCAH